MRLKYLIAILVIGLLLAAALWGPMVSNVEQAPYTVAKADGDFEIRDYAPMIVAETNATGPRDEAISQGFHVIAEYIFGGNHAGAPKENAPPVAAPEPGQTIAMTAPVMQQENAGVWKVRFVMPSHYTLEQLPTPNNADVKLAAVDGKRFVVVRFSGSAQEADVQRQKARLMEYVKRNELPIAGEPVYAFYNPPWTLPFLRRNEVMLEIAPPAPSAAPSNEDAPH